MKRRGMGEKGFTLSELLVVFVIVIIVAALMTPFIRYSSKRTEKIVCANNLQNIGLAIYIYAREHNGNFPASLKTLYDEQYLADQQLLDCPASKNIGTPESPDYVYTDGLSIKDPSLLPLVRDKADNHPQGGGNILYVNGAVVWKEEVD
ncbi:MAG: prepilin-type N-terminal cleavage/methylation domain-containing protein [Candidatus Omnitrophota bacterium]